MYEKLVESWLTSVNELGYQIPFCEVLVSEGYTILHVSRHGRGEHGKDVIARRADQALCTFQLKGGDLSLNGWRDIRGEVEELVRLPVRLPGVREDEPHVPHLVTNGEIRGDALESVKQFADDWERKGSARLEVWMRGTLLKKFVKAQGNYLPAAVEELRNFVDIYAGPFDTPFPREKLARVLEVISGDRTVGLSKTNLQRAIASLVVIVSYLIEQFARADNHLAAAEGWVMTAANILRIAERECLSPSAYVPSLNLVRDAFERSLDSLADETLGAEHFVLSRGGLADPMLYGVRATQVLGWLCYWVIDRRWRKGHSVNIRTVLNVIRREGAAMSWVGEADWPLRMCLAFFLDREGYASDAERLLQGWASSITAASRPPARPGVPSPYWPQEKVLRLRYGLLPPTEQEHFGHYVYTLEQCLDMLVRRLRRQSVASLWPDASRLILCNFVPGSHSAYFTWNDDSGTLHTVSPVRTARWQDWRQRTAVVDVSKVPITLVRHSEWALPFLIVYPHRANVVMSAFVDALNTGRAAVHAPNETEAPVSAGRKRKPLQESSVAPK